jgi:hypothetical protein
VRQIFSAGAELDRESAIREIARSLGFQRAGSRIAEAINSALIAAVKRCVIANDRGVLFLLRRNIGEYSRDDLIFALLGAMGNKWWYREDATRAAARYLGFTRTGSAIRDAFKSAINGAIRRGLLEYDNSLIRKRR